MKLSTWDIWFPTCRFWTIVEYHYWPGTFWSRWDEVLVEVQQGCRVEETWWSPIRPLVPYNRTIKHISFNWCLNDKKLHYLTPFKFRLPLIFASRGSKNWGWKLRVKCLSVWKGPKIKGGEIWHFWLRGATIKGTKIKDNKVWIQGGSADAYVAW